MAFTRITQLLMLANSCINPLVYATTIPAFKTLIKDLLSGKCKLDTKLNDTEDTTEGLNENETGTTRFGSLKRSISSMSSKVLICGESPP